MGDEKKKSRNHVVLSSWLLLLALYIYKTKYDVCWDVIKCGCRGIFSKMWCLLYTSLSLLAHLMKVQTEHEHMNT